jgi:hypothetical protein
MTLRRGGCFGKAVIDYFKLLSNHPSSQRKLGSSFGY